MQVSPFPLFCIDCFTRHRDKHPHILHHTIPIAALGQNLEEYMRKFEALKLGETELRRNVERIEQYCLEFEDLLQTCIQYLAEYRSCWLWQI